MPLPRAPILLVPLLAITLVAGPVSAQEEPSPSADPAPTGEPSASAAPSAAPQTDDVEVVEKLGGTWRRVAAAPFGAVDVPGGWTGTELVIVDPDQMRRASSYLPALDSWSEVAKPPRKLLAGSEAHWTGSELLFVEPRGTLKRGLTAFDPVGDAWRTTEASPLNEIGTSVWAGDRLVAASDTGGRIATYDPLTDVWAELPAPEGALVISLHRAGEDVWALARTVGSEALAFVPLDLEEGVWGESSVGPLTSTSAPVLWIGDAFVSLSTPEGPADPAAAVESPPGAKAGDEMPEDLASSGGSPQDAGAADEVPQGAPASEAPQDADAEDEMPSLVPSELTDGLLPPSAMAARFDPLTLEWLGIENACSIDSGRALWAEPLIVDVDGRMAMDPGTGQCYQLPAPKSKWTGRTGALRVWTGNEVIDIAGDSGGDKPRRDGVAYDPYPGDDPLGVRLDKGARPVRVRVPSLGIDLPVISTDRKVAGSSPGYPACDVALIWSVFDQPGKPGTAWIMAHAQQGMFLPLLRTLIDEGKHALLGREVDVQLRDGRVLTYRTYRTNPRAINTNIGRKGLRKGEHRLVLQTSTGVGTAPKLVVAARLVDVGTTDEPPPKPRPRACG